MSLKHELKAAKAAIERNDAEDGLYYAYEALKIDRRSYFAHVFRGKSLQLLADWPKAAQAFEAAIDIEPHNLLAWKGYFQVSRDSGDHAFFFTTLAKYLQVLVDQEQPLADPIKEVFNYLHRHEHTQDDALLELYLRLTIPGTPIFAVAGAAFGKPQDNIKRLVDLLRAREDTETRLVLMKAKLKMPRVLAPDHKAQLAQAEWDIRQKLGLCFLYQMLLDFCADDDPDVRRHYESQFLQYKYLLLRIVPHRSELLADIAGMVDDMVLLDTPDLFAWTLHLDLQDARTLADLDTLLVSRFIRKFPSEPLALVLYSFLMCDLCPFDKAQFQDLAAQYADRLPAPENPDELASTLIEVDQTSPDLLSPSEVLELMLQGYEKCSGSMTAHRIVCAYFVHLQEYEAALAKCSAVIRDLAELQRTYGIDLANCKEDVLCLLAVVYTYHEAPKNFGRALQLYDRILQSSTNKAALVGKGLILVAQNNLAEAERLLAQVVKDFPDDVSANSELGWCYVLQQKYPESRAYFEKALSQVTGTSSKAFDTRANLRWRLAKSYYKEDGPGNLQKVYDLLVLSLKDSKTHAPSYTLLGVLYHEHYDDAVRAQKCFYKAFELDVAEVEAARYLVQDLASNEDWEVAEILCRRVVTSPKSRRTLVHEKDQSWPYRVLGCSALNRQDDAKAIEWFQTALRMQAMDTQCWTGLGEAYFNCGRVDAAIKVFQHTTKAAPDSWENWYMLGRAVCAVGDFVAGIELLQKALALKPDTECILNAIYELYVLQSSQLLLGGFVQRTLNTNALAIETILQAAKLYPRSLSLWKALDECLHLIGKVQFEIGLLPVEAIQQILTLSQLDSLLVQHAVTLFNEGDHALAILEFRVLAAQAGVLAVPTKSHKSIRAYTQYNLGLAYLGLSSEITAEHRGLAVDAFKQAIRLELANAAYWLALGNCYVETDPELAQHCYIKASVLDQRDVSAWSNLAALYLRYDDPELAQQAFDRAVSLAPEQPVSWLGNALASEALGDQATASRFSTHAYIVSNGRSPLAQLCYAISIVSNRVGSSKDIRDVEAGQEFSIANFAIQTFLKFSPDNELGLELALLLSERCQTYETSAMLGEKLCSLLEAKFEQSESPELILKVAKAKTTLGRVYLGLTDYDSAIANAQFTLDLLQEEEATKEVRESVLLSRIVIGLAHFFREQYTEALEELQVILGEHSESHRAVTLIAQVLYALDTPETKQAATDQLFEYIEANGLSLLVVLTLGAIAVVDDIAEYFAPIKEELETLGPAELAGDAFRLVPKMLQELNGRLGEGPSPVWQKCALLFPGDYNVWKHLDLHMALSTARLSSSKPTAFDVASLYTAKATRREVQRALLLCADHPEARYMLSTAN